MDRVPVDGEPMCVRVCVYVCVCVCVCVCVSVYVCGVSVYLCVPPHLCSCCLHSVLTAAHALARHATHSPKQSGIVPEPHLLLSALFFILTFSAPGEAAGVCLVRGERNE